MYDVALVRTYRPMSITGDLPKVIKNIFFQIIKCFERRKKMKKTMVILVVMLVALTGCKKTASLKETVLTEEKIPAPGYRPESDYSAAFLSSIGTCRMVVFPTVVRRKPASNDGPIMSSNKASQQAIVKHLTKKNIAESNACMTELDLNWTGGESQLEFFESSMKLMAEQVKQSYPETEYYLALELLIIPSPQNRLGVFGIHVYILNQAGHNAFSFLLNSHHQLFISAELYTENSSKESIEKLIADSTRVALQALDQQIQLAN
jgi:hypothetical protein